MYRLIMHPGGQKNMSFPYDTDCREVLVDVYRSSFHEVEPGRVTLNMFRKKAFPLRLSNFCAFLSTHMLKTSLVVPYNGNGIAIYKDMPESSLISLVGLLLNYDLSMFKIAPKLGTIIDRLLTRKVYWLYPTFQIYTAFYAYLVSEAETTPKEKDFSIPDIGGPSDYIQALDTSPKLLNLFRNFVVRYPNNCTKIANSLLKAKVYRFKAPGTLIQTLFDTLNLPIKKEADNVSW